MYINGKKINALLDTGSSVSLIKESSVANLGLPEVSPASVSAKGITGHECELNGLTYGNIKIGKHKFRNQPFHVIKQCAYDCLVGLDIMSEFGYITLNFQNKQLFLHSKPPRIREQVIPLRHLPGDPVEPSPEEEREEISTVVTTDTRVTLDTPLLLPPRSHIVCHVNVHQARKSEVCYSPNPDFLASHEVWAAHSVNKVTKAGIPILLLNPSDKLKTIPKGTQLGRVEKVRPPVISKAPAAVNILSLPVKKKGAENESIEQKIQELDLSASILTPAEQKAFREFLLRNKEVFAIHSADLGSYTGYEHTINTGDHPPIHSRPYRVPYAHKEEVRRQIQELVDNKIIEPTNSPWASPMLLVKKKDGTMRLCCDFRRLNAITTFSVFPLPNMEAILDQLARAKYYSTMDMQSGFWQLPMAKADRAKTAIVTEDGQYQWLRMPMGLSGAPSSYQCAMNQVLAGLQPHTALIYIDDLVCHSETFDGHLQDLQKVFDRFMEVGLKIKLKKCTWATPSISFLGVTVSAKGIECDQSKVAAVKEMSAPHDMKAVRRFLGMCGYHRRHIPDFAILAKPLFALLKKDTPFLWTDKCQLAFETLKSRLCEAPVLAFPDPRKDYILEMDGSLLGLGACLSQVQDDGSTRPLSYISRTLVAAEKNYASSELECAAVIYALKKFRHYCLGSRVLCITDNSAVSYIMRTKTPSGRLARWSLLLQDFNITFKHRPGTENHVADCLSRAPINAVLPDEPSQREPHPDKALLPSKKRLVEEQKADSKLGPIVTFLSLGTLPTEPEASKEVERQSAFYMVLNGLLYRKGDDEERMLAVPLALVPAVLFAYHESMFANHPGAARMFESIKLKYHWPSLAKDVKAHVKACMQCQRRKPLTRSMEPRAGNLIARRPFELISMDLQELPVTPEGNRHLLVMVDYFTRYVEAVPLKDKSAAVTAEAFMSEWVSRHGVPETVLTDNAPNFTSPDMKKTV